MRRDRQLQAHPGAELHVLPAQPAAKEQSLAHNLTQRIGLTGQEMLDLADWRRRVGDLYRLGGDNPVKHFRAGKDELFGTHPQSPIAASERSRFEGLSYFDPDPAYRVSARLHPASDQGLLEIDTGGEDGVIRYRRAGRLRFDFAGQPLELTLFSMLGYGGGLFLPFRDSTAGHETYGAGRYLVDTVKNTDRLCIDMAPGSSRVVLDFNYAYNPSCAYDARWACPLAPPENWLPIAIRAGEKVHKT